MKPSNYNIVDAKFTAFDEAVNLITDISSILSDPMLFGAILLSYNDALIRRLRVAVSNHPAKFEVIDLIHPSSFKMPTYTTMIDCSHFGLDDAWKLTDWLIKKTEISTACYFVIHYGGSNGSSGNALTSYQVGLSFVLLKNGILVWLQDTVDSATMKDGCHCFDAKSPVSIKKHFSVLRIASERLGYKGYETIAQLSLGALSE